MIKITAEVGTFKYLCITSKEKNKETPDDVDFFEAKGICKYEWNGYTFYLNEWTEHSVDQQGKPTNGYGVTCAITGYCLLRVASNDVMVVKSHLQRLVEKVGAQRVIDKINSVKHYKQTWLTQTKPKISKQLDLSILCTLL